MSASDDPRAPLDAGSITAAVRHEGGLWSSVEVASSLRSSNETLGRRATEGSALPGTVLVAEEQTEGRGRRGRGWVAPQYSSVMVSVLARPEVEPARWGWLPLLTALAVVDAVGAAGVDASIKWPNDVLVGEAKLAGVLCEVVQTPEGNALIAGWGVNVDQRAHELPGPEATSLRLVGGSVDRPGLLTECLLAWERWYRRWLHDDPSLQAVYASRSGTLGRRVRLHLPDGNVVRGTAIRLSSNGSLVVDVEGEERSVAAADVVHLRLDGLPR